MNFDYILLLNILTYYASSEPGNPRIGETIGPGEAVPQHSFFSLGALGTRYLPDIWPLCLQGFQVYVRIRFVDQKAPHPEKEKKKVWIVSLSKQRIEGMGIKSVGLDSMLSHGLTHQLTGKSEVSLNMTACLAGSTTVHDFGM